jgi:hypothetical protein
MRCTRRIRKCRLFGQDTRIHVIGQSRFSMDAAGEFLFGASDLNTLDLPLPIAAQAKMGPKGTLAEGTSLFILI